MIVCPTVAGARAWVREQVAAGRSSGFVPTMGALHEGHLSLIRRAASENDAVAISIFVNPLQFGAGEDFERYPRNLQRDTDLAAEAGADMLFAPSPSEMYPNGRVATMVDVGRLGQVLEGKVRPGHFSGVATACAKLFNIVPAGRAYFGQKDAQQVAVVSQMVRDLSFATEIVVGQTVREPDGLALSSRNVYLDAAERRAAPALARGLFAAAQLAESGEQQASRLSARLREEVAREPRLELQYAEVVDPETFSSVQFVNRPAVLVAAVVVGRTRLIDNVAILNQEVGTGSPA